LSVSHSMGCAACGAEALLDGGQHQVAHQQAAA
jgi:hypothetical protein